MVFKDLLLFCWEGLVTNWTIQTKGLHVLLLQGVIENAISKVRFAGGASLHGEQARGRTFLDTRIWVSKDKSWVLSGTSLI